MMTKCRGVIYHALRTKKRQREIVSRQSQKKTLGYRSRLPSAILLTGELGSHYECLEEPRSRNYEFLNLRDLRVFVGRKWRKSETHR